MPIEFSQYPERVYTCPLSLCFRLGTSDFICAMKFDYGFHHCDTLLMRWKNNNQLYRQIRINALLKTKNYKLDQEVNKTSKGQHVKLLSIINETFMMTTDYYSEFLHDEILKAIESDTFEIFYNGRWDKFVAIDTYKIEWEEAPNPLVGRGTVKLNRVEYSRINNF